MRLKTALAIWPRLWGATGYLRPAGYIFVIGHMRSYSSLLTHILGSHPKVSGYAEMHQKYRNWLDLLELNSKVERTTDKLSAHRYVLDKILHPQALSPRVMARKDLRAIAIAREPRSTIASILQLRAGGIDSTETAVRYYVERMQTLLRVAEMRRGDLVYLDGESLVEGTDRTLARLTDYLQLTPQLRSEYSIFRFTGVPKYGDPSDWIKSGRVIASRGPRATVELDRSQLERVSRAYEQMRAYMEKHAKLSLTRAHH